MESSWPSFFYLIMVWVTYVFWTQPSDSLTGTLECTCSFNTLRTKDLETIWQPVSGKAACPLVHPPLPVNRVTPVYLFMISFFPPPSVGNTVLFWDVKAAPGLSLQDHGRKSIKSKDNVNSQHQLGVIHVTMVNNSAISVYSLICHIFVLIPSLKDQVYSCLLCWYLG